MALALLEGHPDICKTISRRYALLLVDEFQDLSPPQLKLIKKLTTLISKVMIVGDEAQRIYGFCQAGPDTFNDFSRWFPTAHLLQLTKSHRCSQPILNLANTQRATLAHVTPLTLTSGITKRCASPLYLPCASLDLQNAAVLNVYHRLTQHKRVAPYDITILARNKISLREVHRYLEIHGVPARVGDRRVLEAVGDHPADFPCRDGGSRHAPRPGTNPLWPRPQP